MMARPNDDAAGSAPEVLAALDSARALVAAGIPVILGRPAKDANGDWNPTGGAGGYVFDRGWQAARPDPAVIDRWKPGYALALVTGHGLDLLDFDRRGGGDDTYRQLLTADLLPTAYAEAVTPSDGVHLFVKSMGVRSRDGVRAGLDVKAGADGVGHGFAFLAPTRRKSKGDSRIRPYVWQVPPDVTRFAEDGPDDDTGTEIAEMVRQAHSATGTGPTPDAEQQDPFVEPPKQLWDNVAKVIADNTRHDAVHLLASALRGRGGWRVDDAVDYMTATVYPLLDQTRGGHPYLMTEFLTDVKDVFSRYMDGGVTSADDVIANDGMLVLLDRAQLANLPKPQPLIADTLDQGTVAVIAGYFGSLKSFIALDWQLCIALGVPWLRRRGVVTKFRTLLVAAEGAQGLNNRITAWERHRGIEVDKDLFMTYPHPVHLGDRASVRRLADTVAGEGIGSTTIDTLAKCMPGMDENSAKDMSVAVAALYKIREASVPGGIVTAVHHTGKDKTTVRGSSALESGVDTVYKTLGDAANVVLSRTKRKDGPTDDVHRLQLEVVEGTHSGVVIDSNSRLGITPGTRELYSHIHSNFSETGSHATTMLRSSGMPESSFYYSLNSLIAQGLLVKSGSDARPFYRLREGAPNP